MKIYFGKSHYTGWRARIFAGVLVVTGGSFLLVAGSSAKGISTTTSAAGEVKPEATGCTCGTVKTPKGTGTGHSGGGGVILTGG